MSLYEALDKFVGAGALACAGLVGAEMPAGVVLDGGALSRHLRERGLAEPFGAALDTLAHAVYFARERHGISQEQAERHAVELAALLSEMRLAPADLAIAVGQAREALTGGGLPAGARLADAWLSAALQADALARHRLDESVARFLLVEMLGALVDTPRLLVSLKAVLLEHRDRLAAGVPRAAQPPPMTALAPPPAVPTPAIVPATPRPSLPQAAVRRLQAILAQQPMSAEHRLARLDEIAGWLEATIAQLRRPANDTAVARQHKAAAAAALEAGDLERAFDHLKAVRDEIREGRRRVESRIADELESLRRQMVEEAAATARLGELALARMDLDLAAGHFADAAGNLPAREQALELEYRQRQAEALGLKAEITATVRDLEAAAQAYRGCRRLLQAGTDPRTRARIEVGLGDMLLALGLRAADAGPTLDEAVAVYASAVAGIDRAARPMQWALVQLSHAAALIALGERRGDRDRPWKAAATALMPALEVFESRGAADLAEAARAKLRTIAAALGAAEPIRLLAEPARAG